jgi:NTE family protein
MNVGLVLGAGGVMGGAWLTGALEALAAETGWDPGAADRIVGTSAGAMIGALVAAGLPPWFMVAHSAGERFPGLAGADGRPAAEADRSAGAVFRLERRLPAVGPGSLGLALRTLRAPHRHTPAAVLSGWLPRGWISTAPLRDIVQRVVPEGWVERDGVWIVACDYATGRRVAFGRPGAPPAELADAVAASCAIPGFYAPVRIGDRDYVDGGMYSPSNLDLLREEDELDLVICLNPTSTRDELPATAVGHRVAATLRGASGRRLGHEARRVREGTGARVVLLQPTREDLEVMGSNLMDGRRRHEGIETARRTVRAQLAQPEVADALAGLPAGEPHKIARPAGSPASWPQVVPVRRPPRRAA